MLIRQILFCIWLVFSWKHESVAYDKRSLLIDGEPKLIFAGHIHYPRSDPSMWPELMKLSKDAGLNAIDTYVFWNEHEEIQGVYDFIGRRDIRQFIKLAQDHELYVILRIGPYVCAEDNYGGLPSWLKSIPGIVFRTNNEQFKIEMQRFVQKIVEYVNDLFYVKDGPIILLQIENEYGLIMDSFQEEGRKYMDWAVEIAYNATNELPWFACQQKDLGSLLNTCNGFYCDNWIDNRAEHLKSQPPFWTENWTGWYQKWWESSPYRPTEDLLFATARFIQRGGALVGYYMFHGGTNFGRMAGGPGITTSYDYDAPIDEYGIPNNPKYRELQTFHKIIQQVSNEILTKPVEYQKIGDSIETHTYGTVKFIGNWGHEEAHFEEFTILPWSVSILANNKVLYSTSAKSRLKRSVNIYKPIDGNNIVNRWFRKELIGISYGPVIEAQNPLEHFVITKDKTDYAWYVHEFENSGDTVIILKEVQDHVSIFVDQTYFGSKNGGNDISFKLNLSPGKHQLAFLVSTVGGPNFGAYFEQYKTGLVGDVLINDKIATGWKMQSGLEMQRSEQKDIGNLIKMNNLLNLYSTKNRRLGGMIWYFLQFEPLTALGKNEKIALDLGSMTKGFVYVNGVNLGRYWNLPGMLVQQESSSNGQNLTNLNIKTLGEECNYVGGFNPANCRDRFGQAAQRYFHVPNAILRTESLNNVWLFEEIGGNALEIKFNVVTRSDE